MNTVLYKKWLIVRDVGAKVVVCPTDVEPTDPRSYYSVSKRLAEETPNGWYVNQYDNPSNAQANYEQTGPEIWEQTEGKITHFIVGVGYWKLGLPFPQNWLLIGSNFDVWIFFF